MVAWKSRMKLFLVIKHEWIKLVHPRVVLTKWFEKRKHQDGDTTSEIVFDTWQMSYWTIESDLPFRSKIFLLLYMEVVLWRLFYVYVWPLSREGSFFIMTQALSFLSLFEKQLFFSLFQSLRDSLTCKFHGIIIIYFIQTQRVNILCKSVVYSHEDWHFLIISLNTKRKKPRNTSQNH